MAAERMLELRFQARFSEIRTALNDMRAWLQLCGFTPEILETSELVLAEVLNNIAEHAFPDHRPGNVDCRLSIEQDSVHVIIEDGGRPMPGGHLPAPLLPKTDVPTQDLPEGGFGWFLIFSLTEGLSYYRRGDRNVLNFRIPAAKPHA